MVSEEFLQQHNIQSQDRDLDIAQNKLALEQQNSSLQFEEANQNIVTEQLNLADELRTIENLLRNKIRTIQSDGTIKWVDSKNDDDRILTESGINLILSTIQWYLNKNTLLSNYEESMINEKMEDFATSLSDAIFMNYGKYFLYPTMKECQEVLETRLRAKVEAKKYNAELRGESIDEEYWYNQFVDEINADRERTQIKEQLVKNKLKGFELIMRKVQDLVHSTYLRAWKGQERTTLRQHIHISENRNPTQQVSQSRFNPFNVFKRV